MSKRARGEPVFGGDYTRIVKLSAVITAVSIVGPFAGLLTMICLWVSSGTSSPDTLGEPINVAALVFGILSVMCLITIGKMSESKGFGVPIRGVLNRAVPWIAAGATAILLLIGLGIWLLALPD